MFIFLFLVFGIFGADVSIVLKTDKLEYFEGEMVNISLDVFNSNIEDIIGQLSSKSFIGNSGFDISCYEFNFVKETGINMGIMSIPAEFSSSQTRTLTAFSACGGSQSQSTQTVVDNSIVVSLDDEETFVLNPFKLKYTFNETEFEIVSNSLEIIVKKKSEEQKEQEEKEKQEEQERKSEEEKKQSEEEKKQQEQQEQQQSEEQENQEQSQQEQEKPEGLNQQQQNALSQNQENSQSLNQLKNEIQKLEVNESQLNKNNLTFENQTLNLNASELEENMLNDLEEKGKSWLWILWLIIGLSALYYVFVKYFLNEETEEVLDLKKSVSVPYFELLLDKALEEKDYKISIKYLAQSIREFLKVNLTLVFVPTNLKALKLTNNILFVKVLKKAEMIEFAKFNDGLIVMDLVKDLRKEYSKNLKNNLNSNSDNNEVKKNE